jgi:hypothetical protein
MADACIRVARWIGHVSSFRGWRIDCRAGFDARNSNRTVCSLSLMKDAFAA